MHNTKSSFFHAVEKVTIHNWQNISSVLQSMHGTGSIKKKAITVVFKNGIRRFKLKIKWKRFYMHEGGDGWIQESIQC